MEQEKFKNDMMVSELARMTNVAFIDLEVRMQTGFQKIRRDTHIEFHETERRLLDAINGIGVRKPEFEALRDDIESLSDRVNSLEKKL
jgi:polyhydroxyalkanoate synthesis regulator phasin